jgi:hypothetical protein
VQKTKSSLTPDQEAVAAQNELLARGWPTSAEVGRANGGQFDNPAQWAKNKRDAGELLGVWSPADNTWRYPDFQFLPDGRLNSRVKELLNALELHPDFNADKDRGGWHRTFWLHRATRGLAGPDGRPCIAAEVCLEDPDAVIAFAIKDAHMDPNDIW